MPRGQKSKLRAQEKRRHIRGEIQGLKDAQTTAAEEKETPSSSSPVFKHTPQSSPDVGILQMPQRSPSPTTPAAAISYIASDEGAKGPDEDSPSSFQAPTSTERPRKDPLTRKAGILVQFLLYKYKMKEPITKADMLKIVSRKYKGHFPEILRRTSERMELIFGLDLKEMDRSGQSYALVSKLDLTSEENLSSDWGFPKNGLLMPLLGVIFINGNCATEEEIWEFLNMLGIYDGKRHFIFGDTRKLITRDLVKEKYLEYRQVPNSDPPRYEFLWGPRAYVETSKMKVLEFLAKVNDTVPSAFQSQYEEALRDEEERVEARVASRIGTYTRARALPRVMASSFSRIK
ncbi:melanoma-associated antigen B4-like [Tamandua tetradactyla]|uniref:melanoma-associated antigen B4-like n=1 Tax=Tamandua tetradactyla TaxID=48850 RepID=UPI0040541FCD